MGRGEGAGELIGSYLHLTKAPLRTVSPSCRLPPSAFIQNWNSLKDELVQEIIPVLHLGFVRDSDFLFSWRQEGRGRFFVYSFTYLFIHQTFMCEELGLRQQMIPADFLA